MAAAAKLAILQPFEVTIWGERKDTPLHRVMVRAHSEDEAKNDALRQCETMLVAQGHTVFPKVSRVEVLSDVHLNNARKQQTLFEDMADLCIGHSMTDIQGACINFLLTCVQRRHPKLADAEARLDELLGRGKEALKRRYGGEMGDQDKAVADEIGKRLIA